MIQTKGGDYVLECHESGPEIVVYLGVATASLVLTKSVIDLVTTFLKTLQKERHKPLSSVKLSHRRITDGNIQDEILTEISFPLSDDTVRILNGKIQQALQRGAKQSSRTAFHLDCTANLAECGCACERCIEEMEAVFGGVPGVSRFYREGDGVVVEHDAGIVTPEQLMGIFRGLPSFYQNHFAPSIMENPGDKPDACVG